MLPYNRWYVTAIGAALIAIGCAIRGDVLYKRAEEADDIWQEVTEPESGTNESSSSQSSQLQPESLPTNSE